jgi:hypothetical protein
MRNPNVAEPTRLERIVLSDLWPSGAHPVNLLGRFVGAELVFVSAPDMAISWTRAVGQAPEAFEEMVSNAILEMRGLQPLD